MSNIIPFHSKNDEDKQHIDTSSPIKTEFVSIKIPTHILNDQSSDQEFIVNEVQVCLPTDFSKNIRVKITGQIKALLSDKPTTNVIATGIIRDQELIIEEVGNRTEQPTS